MPSTLFDSAGLAVVAYADVASDGSSPITNSGVTTARVSAGKYSVTLPAGLTQNDSDDLILVTPKGTVTGMPWSASVDDSDPAVKIVGIYGGSPLATLADSDFSILILRTIVPLT